MQSSTRFITNCDRYYKVRHGLLQIAMVPVHDLLFKVLKHISNHFKFQLQTINELDKLYTKTDMYIYYFRIPHNTFCLFSNLHKFLLSKALQEIFNPPNSLCRNGGKQCIMGNSNHSILCIYTIVFSSIQIEKIIII